jgi:NAD(P)-dependent dehydrogenase (short-subunit alcohol dehydrogenase family)
MTNAHIPAQTRAHDRPLVALVTGAAGDIGAATARAFAADGAHIILTDRRQSALEAIAQSLRDTGARVAAIGADQSDPQAVDALFEQIDRDFGQLDCAFLNAGYGKNGLLIDMPYDQWRKHIDVNLNGGFLMAQGAARLMRRNQSGGSIVINASTAAHFVCDQLGAYAASKSGLVMLAKSLASELGIYRIRVNLIMPGVIATKMTQSLVDDPVVRADVLRETPAGRIGTPDDIAALVHFLCSPAAGYITGSEILVDGGQTIHGYPRWFSADYTNPGASFQPHPPRP